MTTTEIEVIEKLPRVTLIDLLIERDGTVCQYPDCGEQLDFSITDDSDKRFVTIDHWMPKSFCLVEGWTWEEIWDLDNLRLMSKGCNAKKGDLVPFEDGTLPERVTRTFRSRRQKRLGRPEVCETCNSGRLLGENEWCNACGSGPQPARAPKWRQMPTKDCDHDLFYCANCFIGIIERRSALDTLITGGDGYE